ncbi:MAG TPA: ribonuclease J [Dehalococcoidia bacterium]|nr:ribonuclease J [Dehalococcoidia bacterium]
MAKQKLRVIPLGGLGEIGKNMLALEFDNDIIVIDAGLMFPKEDQYGVDLVIPDISYLTERREKVRGIIITHGHEDHTGALPYVLRELKVPVYGTRLTLGLISVKLKEHRLKTEAKLKEVTPGEIITMGKFKVEFFSVCHSIPDAAGLIIRTPVGVVVHSGDFKLDHTPVTGHPSELARLAQVALQEPLLLLSDSTYAELPGYTPSERLVGETFDRIFADAAGRIMVTTFSSLISRVQQVLDAAARHGRYVVVVGRSMTENVRISRELGYLTDSGNVLRTLDQIKGLPHNKIALVTTGSQGEPTSALVRISNRDHKQLHIIPGDTVVMSATPVPGNEALVNRTIDNLFRQGAKVLWDRVAMVHVHGHGSQEELKLLINLIRPKYFVPIHGEYRHMSLHAGLARSLGMPDNNIFVLEDGDVLELTEKSGKVAEKVSAGPVYVNGLSVGDIGSVILRDRKLLAQDGIVVAIVAMDKRDGSLVGRPDIVSRGFVDEKESPELLEQSRDLLAQALSRGGPHVAEWAYVSGKVKDTLSRFFYEQTKRRPMILPVLVEV